jgi:hypothetical protein
MMVNEPFETQAVLTADGRRPIDAGVLAQVQALFVPVAVILDLRQQLPKSLDIATHQAALAGWFKRAAAWIRDGTDAAEIARSLPGPPEATESVGVWYRLLDEDIRSILAQVAPEARAAPDATPDELRLAAG